MYGLLDPRLMFSFIASLGQKEAGLDIVVLAYRITFSAKMNLIGLKPASMFAETHAELLGIYKLNLPTADWHLSTSLIVPWVRGITSDP